MRSRYSAYATLAYQYIADTYAELPRATLDANTLAAHDKATQWKALEVLQAQGDTVSFKAYYLADGQYYCMHEISQFVKENGQWRYLKGEMQNGAGKLDIGRNSACPCNSGKKFKRCCASA